MLEASLNQVQKYILETQGLIPKKPVKSVMRVIRKIHNVQIDTISVVARSHDLILYNRVHEYHEGNVWNYLEKGKLFEYWSHGMCLIPIQNYPFYAWKMQLYRESKKDWLKNWASKNQRIIEEVYLHVKKNGATPSKQLGKRKTKGGGWWDWKVEKYALEYLFYIGNLMVAYRKGFQKYYDLTERVLPAGISSEPMQIESIPEFVVMTTLASLGIASAQDINLYLGRGPSRKIWNGKIANIETYLDRLIEDDEIEEVIIEGVNQRYFILQKQSKKIIQEDGDRTKEIPVKLLSPFDNIMRERHRPLKIWNFDYKLEAYTQAHKRKYGYYVLPILDGFKLVGRLDPKVHRKEHKFEIKALHFEGDFWKDERCLERLSKGIQSFAKFHECTKIKLVKTSPKKTQPILQSFIDSLL